MVYLSSIREPAGTKTKVPDIKYTPSSMFTDEPFPVGFDIDDAVLLPSILEPPPTIPNLCGLPLELNSSPAANVLVVLFVPDVLYLMYTVFGSEPVALTTCNTSACIPLVAPVIVVPTSSVRYESLLSEP